MRNHVEERGRRGHVKYGVTCRGSTACRHGILASLNAVEVKGMTGVAVKCVDIRRNIGGVSALLGRN